MSIFLQDVCLCFLHFKFAQVCMGGGRGPFILVFEYQHSKDVAKELELSKSICEHISTGCIFVFLQCQVRSLSNSALLLGYHPLPWVLVGWFRVLVAWFRVSVDWSRVLVGWFELPVILTFAIWGWKYRQGKNICKLRYPLLKYRIRTTSSYRAISMV